MATIREIRARFTAEVRGATQAFRQVRDEANRLGVDTQRATQQTNNGFNDVIRTAGRMRAALAEAGDDDAFRDLQQAIDRTEDDMQRLGTVSDEAMDDLGRAIRTSGEHLSGLSGDARTSMSQVENAVEDANQTFRRLGRDTGLNGLRNDVNDAGNNLNDLEDDVRDVDRTLDAAEDGLRDFGDTAERESSNAEGGFGRMRKALGGLAGLVAGAFAVDQIKDFGTELAASAGGAQALEAQFSTVFGDMEGEASKRLGAISEEATILEERMKGSFTKIAAFAKTGGMDTADSLDLADRSMRAIADSAAFYDRSLEDTTESLQSFLKGNYENDAALGLSATEMTRNNAAMDLYGKKFIELDEAQKQLTLLQMVEDANKVTGALGQASRESTGWENVMGNMSQAWENFKAKIGAPVLEVAVKALVAMTAAMEALPTEAIGNGIKKAFGFIAGTFRTARDALEPFINGIKTAKDVVDGLLFDDGQKGRDLLEKLGFTPETIARLDGYAAKFAEFRWYIKDVIDGVKGLFKDDGSGGRDILAQIGFSPELIGKMDKFAQNFSAFRYNISDVMTALFKILNGDKAGGINILQKLGFSDGFIQKIDGFMSKMKVIGGVVAGVASTMGAAFAKYAPQIGSLVQKVLIDLWPKVKDAVGAVVGFVVSNLAKILAFWNENGPQFLAAVTNVFKGIAAVIQFVMPVVLAIIKSVWGNVKGVITGALDIIMGVIKIFSGLFTGDFKKMWEGVKQLFKGAVTFIWNFVQLTFYGKILGGAKTFIAAFKGGFASMWAGVKALFTGGVGAAWQTIKAGWAQISGATKTVFSGIWNFLKATFTTIKNLFTSSFNFWKTTFSGGFSSLFNTAKTGLTNIKSWFGNIFRDIVTAVRGRFSDIVDLAKALPGRIGQGIGNMASKVKSGVTKVINALASTLGKGVNGVIGGINWVLGKIGVDSKVPSWDVPKYAQGTKGKHPGGLAMVNDGKGNNAGPELIKTPDGKMGTLPGRNVITNLPKGSEVLSARNTREYLKNIPAYAFGTDVWNGIKHYGGKALGGIKKAGNKARDIAVDVFDYINNPSKFLDLGLKALGVKKPSGSGFIPGMAKGAYSKVKTGAVAMVKKALASYGAEGGGRANFGGAFRKSSSYGWRIHPVTGKRTFHNGDDWAAPAGTPIPNQAAGYVVQSGYHPIRGNYVRVKSGAYERIYQHNTRNHVKVGDAVKKGQIIGTVGSTGRSTGPHLHFEVLKNGENIAPGALKDVKTASGKGVGGWGGRGVSAASKYLAAIVGDGDWMNDWATHLPKNKIKSALGYGKKAAGYIDKYGGSARNYFEAIADDGDWANDWATHLPKAARSSLLKVGKALSDLQGFENGGIVDGKFGAQLAWLTEGGWSESVISHDPSKRTSQKAIWEQTGRELGFMGEGSAEMVELLRRIADGVESGHGHDIYLGKDKVGQLLEPVISEWQSLKKGTGSKMRK